MKALNKLFSKKSISSSIALLLSGLLTGVILMFVINSGDRKSKEFSDNTVRLTMQTDNLLSGFTMLQQLSEDYASLLSDKSLDSIKLKELDSMNILITRKEIDFSALLDSLQSSNHGYDKSSSILFIKIIDSYRSAVSESKAIRTIRNSFNIGNTNFTFDQNTLYAMQNALHNKEVEIVQLNSKLYSNKNLATNNNKIDYNNLFKQQESVVDKVLESQKKKNENLTSYNAKLKRENDNLYNELETLRDSNIQNQIKTASTITKAELNEQLKLAKVDCYLLRADTRQIISNAKQRRELLQTAQQLLNSLSQSGSNSVKEEVQSKLNELKTIAANDHD